MTVQNSIALVTGANRGIGRAIVEALLARGAAKIYAAARSTDALATLVALDPARVVPLQLDVTDPASIAKAAGTATDVTLLINNAGALDGGTVFDVTTEAFDRNFDVNVRGPLRTAQAFAPALRASKGAIVNLLSVVGLAAMPGLAVYSASKAAAVSLTQSLRGALAADGVSVHGVFPGPVDTDMAAEITLPKTAPDVVANAILDGVEAGTDDIYPDPMAQQVGAAWATSPKSVEQMFAA